VNNSNDPASQCSSDHASVLGQAASIGGAEAAGQRVIRHGGFWLFKNPTEKKRGMA